MKDFYKFAVFDVDNTVLGFKSLFEFARFYCEKTQIKTFYSFNSDIQRIAKEKGREAANKHFYTLFKGATHDQLNQLIERWATPYWATGWPLVSSTLFKLREHQDRCEKIIWLSGSATVFLEPLATAMNIDYILASELETDHNVYTGRTSGTSVIGQGKLERLIALLQREDLKPVNGVGYGDHLSDLPFLDLLGEAIVVAGDPELEAVAYSRNWEVIPGKSEQTILNGIGKYS